MKISEDGINLIKSFEGLRLKAYRDAAGVATIGYGHTKGVVLGQIITEAKADEYLRQDIVRACTLVSKYESTYHWNQNEYDAMVSFCFNIGSITALTKFGTRTKEQIAKAMLLYVNAGGVKLNGLVKRRKAEHDLFLKPIPNQSTGYIVGSTYTVLVSGLRIRSGASTDAPIIGSIRKGSKIKVKEVVSDTSGNIWIKYSKGYLAALYKGNKYIGG